MKQTRREYKQESFQERHQRVTLYLEKEINQEIQYRREQGSITNMTQFFNDILREHLKLN